MFSQPKFTEYGYRKQEKDKPKSNIPHQREIANINYNMDTNIHFGRYCQSGIAAIIGEFKMICVTIDEIKSNYDDYKQRQGIPAYCVLKKKDFAACKYYYYDKNGQPKEINHEYCECSLMEEQSASGIMKAPVVVPLPNGRQSMPRALTDFGIGFCPIPLQPFLDAYIKNYTQLIKASPGLLHTFDRDNLDTMFEILVQRDEVVSNSTWAATVVSKFKFKFYPFIQSNQTHTCVDIVMKESPTNMFKLGGGALAAGGAVFLGIISII